MGDRDDETSELLRLAAQTGEFEKVRRLLATNCDPNDFDELGRTALHYAARNEHLEIAALLLEHGARVDARHEATLGNTPLGEVAATCSLNMAQLLIESGANPTVPGWMQITALDRAKKRQRGDGPRVHELLVRAARRWASGPG